MELLLVIYPLTFWISGFRWGSKMLFNSFEFLLGVLPLVLVAVHYARQSSSEAAMLVLPTGPELKVMSMEKIG